MHSCASTSPSASPEAKAAHVAAAKRRALARNRWFIIVSARQTLSGRQLWVGSRYSLPSELPDPFNDRITSDRRCAEMRLVAAKSCDVFVVDRPEATLVVSPVERLL